MSLDVLEVLSKNRQTEIGRKWNFANISNVEEFRETIPLTDYADYKQYIDRMAEKGEQNLITSDNVTVFSHSSATTGQAKYIPGVAEIPSMDLIMPSGDIKILHLTNIPDNKSYTPYGMPVESLSVRVVRHLVNTCPDNYIVPYMAYDVSPLSTALYIQMVFGLKEDNLNEIRSVFITAVINAVLLIKTRWRDMINDIRTGKFNSLTIGKRDALEKFLGGPDPIRADVLQKIFEQVEPLDCENMLSKIWPKLKVIKCLCSGNMSCFIPTLRYYCGPSIHISSYWYGCTETDIIGIPAKPMEEVSLFRLAPNNFYEFIPIEQAHEKYPHTLLTNEVEEENIYEIVLTTFSGFYRYRIGDFVKIIEQTKEFGPLFDFHGRGKMTLALDGHTLYEANVEKAMTNLTSLTSSRVDYIVSIDTSTFSKYKIWIECAGSVNIEKLDEFLDDCLRKVDAQYNFERVPSGRVDMMSVAYLKVGTFGIILDYMKSKTSNAEAQLKIPRMAFDVKIQKILEENKL